MNVQCGSNPRKSPRQRPLLVCFLSSRGTVCILTLILEASEYDSGDTLRQLAQFLDCGVDTLLQLAQFLDCGVDTLRQLAQFLDCGVDTLLQLAQFLDCGVDTLLQLAQFLGHDV
ncbi:hypothetical protein STEG23_027200 [Scotinomys teguina]